MTFATQVAQNGHGVAFAIEASTDRFGSIPYHWGTTAHEWTGTPYAPRIVSIGRLQRGLTIDHNLAATTVEVVLNNSDRYFDFLCDRSSLENGGFNIKFRIFILAFDPSSPSGVTRKQLGQFGLLDWPRRGSATVTLSLADDTSIDGAEFALAPTLKDWVELPSSTPANNPLCKDTSTLVDSAQMFLPYEAPVQLAFGNDYVDLQKTADFEAPTSTHLNWSRRSLVVCATTDPAASNATDVEDLYVKLDNLDIERGSAHFGEAMLKIPSSFKVSPLSTTASTVWTARRSESITKDGRQWRIIWVDIDMQLVFTFLLRTLGSGGNAQGASGVLQPYFDAATWRALEGGPSLYELLEFSAAGFPYSSRTYRSNATGFANGGVRAPEIAYDLLAYYSAGLSNADVDLTSFQQACQVLPYFYATGVIDDMAELSSSRENDPNPSGRSDFVRVEQLGGALRKHLADLARSGSFDMFVSWEGIFTATAQVSIFSDLVGGATSLPELLEMRIVDGEWEDRVPSPGERWAPGNRLYLEGRNGRIGPFDNANAITAWGRKLARTLSTPWVDPAQYAAIARDPNLNLFNTAALESKARPKLKFVYGTLEALNLELGDYFRMSISRDAQALYSQTVFKVEQLDLLPGNLGVYIEAIWYGDVFNQLPYFLDDETYSLIVSSTPGRTIGVADGFSTLTFASGNLVSDGVQGGDVVVLKDSSQAANVFSRYRTLLIQSVTDATHLVVADADLDFGAPGSAFVTDWEIHRGATTYGLLTSSDPTHYPSSYSQLLYGKVTDANGLFSDATDGNQLLDG